MHEATPGTSKIAFLSGASGDREFWAPVAYAFSRWMQTEKLISNPNAPVDGSANELLAGQGV